MQKRKLKTEYCNLEFGDRQKQWVNITLSRIDNFMVITSWNKDSFESKIHLPNVDIDEAVSKWCYDPCLTIENIGENRKLFFSTESEWIGTEPQFVLLSAVSRKIGIVEVAPPNFKEDFKKKLFEISEPVDPSEKDKLLTQAQELIVQSNKLSKQAEALRNEANKLKEQ